MKILRQLLFVIAAVVIVLLIVDRFVSAPTTVRPLDYGSFIAQLESGKIESFHAVGKLGTGKTTAGKSYTVTIPNTDSAFVAQLQAHIKSGKWGFESPPNTSFLSGLGSFLPMLALVVLMIFIFRQAQSGGSQAMNFGRSRAKMLSENRAKVTFEDVAGVEEAKVELGEIVDFLKYPKKYQSLGARIPKGVLLLGPPGSGKTLLARAVAGEAGVPFFSISGSDFVEMFVGVGASRVRDLFEQAKKSAPCIIFIDEIDAVGRQRGAGLGGGHDEREQTLNQLLVEMDGFDQNTGVILIAATNRPDVLDPALLRPGRFDRQIVVDRADLKGRQKILAVHARNKPLAREVQLDTLAKRTPGFSGADLENLLNEAALLAARRNKNVIEMSDCDEAIDRVMVGPERKSMVMSQKEKENTAYHESGHAILGAMLDKSDPIHKVTIIPRGMALGITWSLPEDDRHSVTREELLSDITMALGGRLAEEIQFGDVTTGASNDFEKATQLARRMVTQYGMSDLGPIQYGRGAHQVFLGRDFGEERNYSEEVASKIDSEVRRIVETCYERGRQLLTTNWDKVERMVASLLEHETVEADEVMAIVEGRPYDRGSTEDVPEVQPPPDRSVGLPTDRGDAHRLPPTISPEPA
ncbi:MAG: ATP-dependent metallopeptidase FtsH/Yme1/Tma family protein [Candidatus Eremiobacteraeota bacterium]|nr:ATP-dependent metallopeptidase FtsH/Yme1/Tma family protein [Candidatus Eremiobacteraeota bacterium]